MRRPNPSRILLAWLLAYAGGLIVTFLLTPDWTARQTVAVVLTGAVVIWYTWETMLLRQVALSQLELQFRPFVVFYGTADGYSVENVGNATALAVRIQNVALIDTSISLDIAFPSAVPILRAGERAPMPAEVFLDGKKIHSVYAAHLDPKYAIADVELCILFRNIEGREYSLVQTVAPSTMDIKGFRETPAL